MEKKEAIEILKSFLDKSALPSIRIALETVIPELAESEDKKIIKNIKKAVEYYWSDDAQVKNDIIDWLERKGGAEFC